ncbi:MULTISPECIES: DsbA family oxidoreductase [Pseudomonas]|uniref:DSBA oxidoreductase n=1 Tax=Pseudomonas fluorescens LMG 5329 TaxID=1324332 RepID=A0A0A1YVF5_PSEFL|nr:DsbA family oxidoreductase [Pseudomonas fluorescens]KGE64447.1 DSBA oxidoreductase [Pseudomonas fluorescens LMG 5329]NWE03278.1 DsbA family oxidoreductase [Pseudomonas sp. IPO3749]NWF19764.1 DsbA family oxidoreductase [Pseudomonas sp. IPO3749]
MTRPVSIDFVSDVMCPWCALGAVALQQAIANLAGEVTVELTFKPFELNPDMPPEGENAVEHMMRKYGRTLAEVTARNVMVIDRGNALGFRFDLAKRTHFYNTFDAHRLLFWAAVEGRQVSLKHILFKAHFSDGENISSHDTLVRLAGEAGLSTARAQGVLDSGEFAVEVRELEDFYRRRGINSVPAMVMNGRHLVAGSQSVEEYEQAIRQIAVAP